MAIHNTDNTSSSKTDKSNLSFGRKVVKIYLQFIGIIVVIFLVFNNIMQFTNYFEKISSKITMLIILLWSIILVLLYFVIKSSFRDIWEMFK